MQRCAAPEAPQLLLALDDDAAAEALLMVRHASLRGEEYYRLVPLAQTMEKKERLLGTVVCYRLLSAILARAYVRAYGHATEYLGALRRATTAPRPAPLQKEQFAERYLRFGRPAEALAWLAGDWGIHEDRHERLLAQVYAALEDAGRLRAVRRKLFDRSGSSSDFESWQASLAPAEQHGAAAIARERAQCSGDPITGAQLLLALDDDAAAEALLVARHASLRGGEYYRLVPLAQTMEKKEWLIGAVVCYRALLTAILARAHVRAYGHAAEYLGALYQLDLRVPGYGSLPTHETFEAVLRNTHGRKVAFWRRLGA